MRHGSLFSGIGGFDLAAEWMGWENVFHCEWMEFPRKVLDYHFPNADSHIDICKTNFKKYANTIDILTGGFPCQPYSTAGKRKGKDDERHLWPEMLRAIREISPRYVVGENVRGLTNWNGGLVFDEVCAELEAIGYQVAPVIIPACGVNAPHRRERIWFVAYANGTKKRNNSRSNYSKAKEIWGENKSDVSREFCSYGDVTDTSSGGIQGYGGRGKNGEFQTNEFNENNSKRQPRMDWEKFPTQSPICGGDDGIPTELDGITFSKWRQESIKGYGNAIVPQVAYEIFKAIIKTAHGDGLLQ